MTTFLPEITGHGLVLWRLRRSTDRQLWCTVHEVDGQLALTLQDPGQPRTAVADCHPHIGTLIDRAEQLRDRLLESGWEAIDVDLDEPDGMEEV